MEGPVNYDILRSKINEALPSKKPVLCFRIKGDFEYMKCGGVQKQEKPYKTDLINYCLFGLFSKRKTFPV